MLSVFFSCDLPFYWCFCHCYKDITWKETLNFRVINGKIGEGESSNVDPFSANNYLSGEYPKFIEFSSYFLLCFLDNRGISALRCRKQNKLFHMDFNWAYLQSSDFNMYQIFNDSNRFSVSKRLAKSVHCFLSISLNIFFNLKSILDDNWPHLTVLPYLPGLSELSWWNLIIKCLKFL